jgi:chemotaxis protein methyltransferase CheR
MSESAKEIGIAAVEFDYLRKLVKDFSAIEIGSGKEYFAEFRLNPLVRESGCASAQHFLQQLRGQSFNGLHRKVLDVMTNNETWFFRDLHPFDALRNQVIPELLSKRAGERRLSFWSAASSSGQEAYSLAMLWRENFHLPGWQIEIVGTDISTPVLARAIAGIYSQAEVNRGLPAAYLMKYFRREGLRWELNPELRNMVGFRELNLAAEWQDVKPMDVIFLRNVLIYFDLQTRKRILAQLRRCLRPGGYLCLGGAETIMNIDEGFERVQFDKGVFYRIKNGDGSHDR